MNFQQAISTCFKKYADFTGVASRAEYWYFLLFTYLGEFLLSVAHVGAVALLFQLACIVPGVAVAVRRMHDRNLAGWFILIPIFNLVQFCMASEPNSRWRNGAGASKTLSSFCPNGHPAGATDKYCESCGAAIIH